MRKTQRIPGEANLQQVIAGVNSNFERLEGTASSVTNNVTVNTTTGGGGVAYRLQYRVEDPAAVDTDGHLGALDYSAYDEIVISLLVDRDLADLTDPTFLGSIDDRKGKKLTLLLTYSGATAKISFIGLILTAPALANQTTSDTSYLQTQRACLEWRFVEDGSAHLCNLLQLS